MGLNQTSIITQVKTTAAEPAVEGATVEIALK
jgi:hypothetical protein